MRRLAPKAAAVAALTAALVAMSCRQIADIGDRSVAPACGPQTGSPACNDCVETRCCEVREACMKDPACAKELVCLGACAADDTKCRSQCARAERAGAGRPLADALACQSRACSSECGAACGEAPVLSAECASCTARSCCASARACAESTSCTTRRLCLASCTDESCRHLCRARDVDGASLESTLTSCEAASCDAACVDWTCLEEPPPGRSPIRLTVVVGDALVAPSPVAGLLVRRCRPFGVDRTCGVEAEQTTGGAGVAGFDVHLDAKARFDGYFEISDPSGRYLPQIVFPLPPPRADTAIYVSVLTPVTREQIAESLGIQGRPEGRGDILVHAVDCARRDVAGLHLALGGAADASATEFYLSRAVPISAARGATATDSFLALGGFLDLTPGSYGLQGMASRDGQPFTAFSTGVYVLPRTLTVIDYASRR